MNKNSIPKKLYKYKPFNVNSLKIICAAEVFYASPTTFNDPLDCKPTIKVDVDRQQLEKLWWKMHIEKYERTMVERMLNQHRYNATEYGAYDDDEKGSEVYLFYLARDVQSQLDKCFSSRGVLSLAEKWNCPLMWSHYADEHRGICIEYSTTVHRYEKIGSVNYKSSRFILASELIEWKVNKSANTESVIFNKYFFSKARQWKYEKEWRVIASKSGQEMAPFNISAIYFGIRADMAIQTTLVKLLKGHNHVKFFEIYPREDGFKFGRRTVDTAEIEACGVNESSLIFAFD